MKTLGLCFLFLSCVPAVNAPAQERSNAPEVNTDKAAIQKSLAREAQTKWPRVDDRIFLSPDGDDPVILSFGDLEPTCVYMRTYRVKRESRDSDVTRPAGYTTCVPMTRFTVKTSGEPKLKLTPSE